MKKQFYILALLLFNSVFVYSQSSSLWGTWESGGDDNAGSVYSINENGEDYTVKYSFPSVIGKWPKGSLCKGKKDIYYGIASGGIYNGGIIFEYRLKSNTYKVLHNFDNSDGRNPQGGLILHDNQLYGLTADGGKNRKGTLFSFSLKNKTLNVEHNFNGEKEYASLGIKSKLALLKNTLYGVTENGGKYSKGSLYSYDIASKIFNNHVDFNDSIGTHPLAALTITKSKTIIGTTSKGASHEDGKLFEYNPNTDNLTQLVSFDKVTGNFMQSQMSVVNDSILIGITSYGGNNNSGVIFEYNLKLKKYTPTVHLSKSSTGSISKGFLCKSEQNEIYGLLSEGSQYHCGSLIKYDFKTKKLSVIEIFDKQKAYDSKNGLIFVDKQTLLGLANSGGKNTRYGNIYSINLKEKSHKQLLNFQSSPYGNEPVGNLILYNDYVYGVTRNGGRNDQGTIYRISVKNNQFEKLIDFYDYNIFNISAGLTLSKDGKMYGFSGNSNPKTLPKIFYYEPKTNNIETLLRFGNEILTKSNKTLTEDSSVVVEKSSDNRIVIKYTTKPDSVNLDELMGDNTESDMLAILTNNKKSKYPFDAPVDTPLVLNDILYGLFSINETPKNGGIFSFDLNTKKLQIIEYYSSNARGNLIPSNNKLLYANYNSVIDSISVENRNYFDKNKDRPYGFINKKDDVFYYFPYTVAALYRKTPTDSTAKVVIRFGIDNSFNLSRKEFNIELSEEWDLARIYVKNKEGHLIEKDSFNVTVTGSALKGPLTDNHGSFYGVTRGGGRYSSGILFKYNPKQNTFAKLFDFPLRKNNYSGGTSSSLIVVKK